MLPHQLKMHGTKSQIHTWLCVEAIRRTEDEEYHPLAVVFIQKLCMLPASCWFLAWLTI
jgi:hypothetical protein